MSLMPLLICCVTYFEFSFFVSMNTTHVGTSQYFPACSADEERACQVASVHAGRWRQVRRGVAPGATRRRPGGVCAAAGGSCRRPSRGPAACCTPRPPPRSPRCLRPDHPDWTAWSSAPTRFSSATWCAGSGTTPAEERGELPRDPRL